MEKAGRIGQSFRSARAFRGGLLPEGGGLRVEEVLDVHSVRRMGFDLRNVSRGIALVETMQALPLVPDGGRAAVCRRNGRVMPPAARPVGGQFIC
jgi:hypothetical protein